MLGKASKTLVFSTFICSFVYIFAFSVFAVEEVGRMTPEERQAAFQERKEAREAKMEERRAQMDAKRFERCERAVTRVALRIGNMSQNRNIHIGNYDRIIERLAEIVASMSEEGLDTSALESDLAAFEDMVAEYESLYSDFLLSLEDHEGSVCEDQEGVRKEAFQGARDHLHNLIAKRKEIRQFFAHEIREDIKGLRLQAEEARQEARGAGEMEDENE